MVLREFWGGGVNKFHYKNQTHIWKISIRLLPNTTCKNNSKSVVDLRLRPKIVQLSSCLGLGTGVEAFLVTEMFSEEMMVTAQLTKTAPQEYCITYINPTRLLKKWQNRLPSWSPLDRVLLSGRSFVLETLRACPADKYQTKRQMSAWVFRGGMDLGPWAPHSSFLCSSVRLDLPFFNCTWLWPQFQWLPLHQTGGPRFFFHCPSWLLFFFLFHSFLYI